MEILMYARFGYSSVCMLLAGYCLVCSHKPGQREAYLVVAVLLTAIAGLPLLPGP